MDAAVAARQRMIHVAWWEAASTALSALAQIPERPAALRPGVKNGLGSISPINVTKEIKRVESQGGLTGMIMAPLLKNLARTNDKRGNIECAEMLAREVEALKAIVEGDERAQMGAQVAVIRG